MDHFNYNGKIFPANSAIIGPDNRGLRYGDGLFETMKFKNNSLILIDEHLSRLWKGMQQLQMDIPKHFTPDILQEQILTVLKKNKQDTARVRVAVFRGNGGLYDTRDLSIQYVIQSWPLTTDHAILNENGLQVCIYTDAKKMIDSFSNIKHNNFLPYLMSALFAKQKQCNDAIILNNHERICDSSIANVFAIHNRTIHTPALSEGCIAGVMRKFVLQSLAGNGYNINEAEITIEFLLDADEVFFTNSIYNLRWVAGIETKTYSNNLTAEIFKTLLQTNPTIFC
ncbi:MAG: aminotransferase class IV [Ferruginibacter sp.]